MVSQVFLSYSRNDLGAAALVRAELERSGLSVFKDDARIREGDLWLERLQQAVDASSAFVVLVGRDGVRRWIGAETQVALSRYFGPHDDALRLPIFPILLGETKPETLPAFLRLFQATNWDGAASFPERLVEQIRLRQIAVDTSTTFEGCPFVGLAAYRMDQAQLFFGRQKETLDALACFFDVRPGSPSVRWLEINGNSGSGKSSLMQAGLLPLIEKGWLWRPSGRFDTWTRIGPMMPGQHPVEMLAESLSRSFDAKMSETVKALQDGDDALRYWLRERKADKTAFLLAIDQFEELFTFADEDQRRQFDGLFAAALEDADCPLFVLSTVRSDFLDRFAQDLPRLVAVRNRLARPWTLGPMGADGLREVIDGPARLAGLDASEVKEAMVAEARDEPGALPLVENALDYLWQQREGNRLSGRLFTEQGGLAGILSRSADDLLADLEPRQRNRALELLFRTVLIDPEGRRHTRRRIPLTEAIAIAGGGKRGRDLVDRLAGQRRLNSGGRHGPLRLITVSEDVGDGATAPRQDRWVNLIHETLIRSKGPGADGKPQPYWPTLWAYIETNKERAARRERLQLMAREWKDRTGLPRLFGLTGWSSLFGFRGLAAPGSLEQRYLRWSRARALVEIVLLAAIAGVIGESVYWARVEHDLPYQALEARWAQILGKELPLPAFGREIPAGSFSMGSKSGVSNEQREHPVTLARPFFIANTEVSFAQYDLFCGATGREKPSESGWGRDHRPVINVHWADAQAYAAWLGAMTGRACRLPSEAEWEYAARAGTRMQYALPAPNGSDDIKGRANCMGCGSEWSGKQTAPVGSFSANAWGLHDMHGNVFEWVEDCWHDSYEGAPGDGSAWREANGGDCGFHVLRSGSWDYGRVGARSAFRFRSYLSNRSSNIGFRVVCSSPSTSTDP
ncbi:MAG: SUMF1/EgtB/PvdO family nonheme iron enzyme [Rhodospirillales bacterium]|nr:SUMF1/EgtB/PvdO family nonheme iron enzyme [Rhodospirillales bacterium]